MLLVPSMTLLLCSLSAPVAAVPQEFPDAGDLQAQDQVANINLIRFADPVEVVLDGHRRSLFYWNTQVVLNPGDEVRMGPASRAVLDYPDGTLLRLYGPAQFLPLSKAQDNPKRLEIFLLERRLIADLSEGKVEMLLPGGNTMTSSGSTRVVFRNVDLRALEIRNTGPASVRLTGPYLREKELEVPGGMEVFLPLPRWPRAFPLSSLKSVISGDIPDEVSVAATEQVRAQWMGDALQLTGEGPPMGVARVSGARFLLPPGSTLKLKKAPLGVRKRKED